MDSVSIVPGSFYIPALDTMSYQIDYLHAALFWKLPPQDSLVIVRYRVFPFKLNPTAQNRSFDSLLRYSAAPIPPPADQRADNRSLFNFGNINAQGSFGRQVGFGNNQDMVLQSNLNIQLSGMLADSIELQAAITDNNVPIQPEGNTQYLNEFDEVYIRFKKKNWQLNVGDMDLREDRSHFLSFYKRLQGISFETRQQLSKQTQSTTLVSGSIAKGKFTRNVFQGLEGNQGPYRLTGANNELFFIVLANTERVFIDGELLQRGEDQDYVIDYNTAELSFTPRRMITKDSRIQVEFEYADRNYLNTNLFVSQDLNFSDKLRLRIGYFSNSDARNSSINQVLDNRQKQLLSQIGDSVGQAYYPAVSLDSFAAGKILYERVYDSLEGQLVDSFYRYSTDPERAQYSLSFTEVGAGKGNYIADNTNANGKVFIYIPPIDGKPQGNFEPVQLLIAPRRQQLLSLGADYSFGSHTVLKTEFAASSLDVNTLSRHNDGDDKGYAAKINLTDSRQLRGKNRLELISSLDYEWVQDRFEPVERLRDVEFSRDWGLPLLPGAATENILRGAATLRSASGNQLAYQLTHYRRSDDYRGLQQQLTQHSDWKFWQFNNQLMLTRYQTATYRGHFFRPILDVSKTLPWLGNWRLGAKYTLEENISRAHQSDTLLPTAFSFDTYTAYLNSGNRTKNKYGISFYTRSDKYPGKHELVRGDRSYNLNLQMELLSSAKRQFYLNTTFRQLKVYDPQYSGQQQDRAILTRAEYTMNEWNGALTGNVLYEAGAGQEQKRAYAYLEVPAGTGQYTWIDYNEDGVQQLNEFELAVFADQATFIRIFTPTNQYVKANYTTLNYSLNFDPRQFWKNGDPRQESFIARFNLISSLQITRKALADGLFEWNPFGNINDTSLITSSTVIANTLSFNRHSTRWGLDLSNLNNNSKALLTYGYETRQQRKWSLKYRHFLSGSISIHITGSAGQNNLFTADNQFENQNYEIRERSVAPAISFIQGTKFRLTGSYKYEQKANAVVYGGQQLRAHALTAETKYNILESASLTGRFTYEGLHYRADEESALTTISYVMLNGLQPGGNYLWNIMLTKRLLKNLELNFQYDGRKPAGTRTVHTGRATLTALF
ncbi:hypothetical protein GCM10027051_13270 [Niabella terrae]